MALQTPLDLSAFDGLALTCGFESDAEPERRTWKATVRTQNDRGEMVYQATFEPPVADAAASAEDVPRETRIPWDAFRLVRGPTVVPDVPPLSAEQCGSVYGLGLIMSRFSARGPMPEFREGPFRLAVHALGVYSKNASSAADASASARPPPGQRSPPRPRTRASAPARTEAAQRRDVLPFDKLAFDEKRRRRKRAPLLPSDSRPGAGGHALLGWETPKNVYTPCAAAECAREPAGDTWAAGLTRRYAWCRSAGKGREAGQSRQGAETVAQDKRRRGVPSFVLQAM